MTPKILVTPKILALSLKMHAAEIDNPAFSLKMRKGWGW
jgi:hypothetical protein